MVITPSWESNVGYRTKFTKDFTGRYFIWHIAVDLGLLTSSGSGRLGRRQSFNGQRALIAPNCPSSRAMISMGEVPVAPFVPALVYLDLRVVSARFCSGLFTEAPRAHEFQVERQLVLQ
jgi:hypothetical protein